MRPISRPPQRDGQGLATKTKKIGLGCPGYKISLRGRVFSPRRFLSVLDG